ncbi:hypothetical protein AB0O05_02700 [Streptomyces sp. NPDC093084]|uniref:hypothetical protein n=1 Tax=Streptomyces sp. NPDC093084 TaxID=3155197 RepID=UPI00342A3853
MINSAQEFVALRTSEDPLVYGRAAQEEAPVAVWEETLRLYPEMAFWVAQNKTVPTEIMALLSQNPEPRVRSMIARKSKVSDSILRRLAGDEDEGVRLAVARNKRASRQILEQLRNDPWSEIKEVVVARLKNSED